MPAINFKKEFVEAVESGSKSQTIRAYRKRPFKEGDKLCLYTGMRTQHCRLLKLTKVKCVKSIFIDDDVTNVDGITLLPSAITDLAKADGFKNISEFREFFRDLYGLPFTGQIIIW